MSIEVESLENVATAEYKHYLRNFATGGYEFVTNNKESDMAIENSEKGVVNEKKAR